MTPLLPAPVSESLDQTDSTDTDAVSLQMLEEVGIRIEESTNLLNNPVVIICVNTQFTHEEKIEELKNYFITINDDTVPTKLAKPLLNTLIPQAIEALTLAGADSKMCPKIYLAIE